MNNSPGINITWDINIISRNLDTGFCQRLLDYLHEKTGEDYAAIAGKIEIPADYLNEDGMLKEGKVICMSSLREINNEYGPFVESMPQEYKKVKEVLDEVRKFYDSV